MKETSRDSRGTAARARSGRGDATAGGKEAGHVIAVQALVVSVGGKPTEGDKVTRLEVSSDAELEADLGIDSILIIELLATLSRAPLTDSPVDTVIRRARG